jgi:hypothetical protein
VEVPENPEQKAFGEGKEKDHEHIDQDAVH